MQENNNDPGQPAWPDQLSRQREAGNEDKRVARARLTPGRVVGAVVVLALLVISVTGSFMALQNSYASTNGAVTALDTSTPTCLLTPTSGATTPTTAPGYTPSPTRPSPTPTPKPSPTSPPVTPTSPPVTPTSPPVTPSPTTAGTATGGATAKFGNRSMLELSYNDTCTPTAVATGSTQTPDVTSTSTPVTTGVNNNTHTSTPSGSGGSGSGMRVVMVILGVVLLLALCLGAGWLMFRHVLMPQSTVRLPPSGARPWSRTRVPNADSLDSISALNMDQFNRNAAAAYGAPPNSSGPGSNNGFGPGMAPNNGYASNMQGFEPGQLSFPGSMPNPNSYAAQANSFAGLSDGFIPPSPQIFPQSEASMIPNGSGAFPLINNTNGFAPASSAFSAMYGLPGDPFASSQSGSPGWLEDLGNGSGSGASYPQSGGPGFAPGERDPWSK